MPVYGKKRKRVGQTNKAKKLKPKSGSTATYRGHKNIKRVSKKKTTPGGPKVSKANYRVGR